MISFYVTTGNSWFVFVRRFTEDKAAVEAMQQALRDATKSPYGMMEDILAALQTAPKGCWQVKIPYASDLGVTLSTAKGWVCKGLGSMSSDLSGVKDEAFVADYTSKGKSSCKRLRSSR